MYKRVQSMISFFRKKDIKINHHNKVKKIYFFNIYVIVYIIIFLFVLLVILFTKFNVKYVSITLVILNIYTSCFFPVIKRTTEITTRTKTMISFFTKFFIFSLPLLIFKNF